MLVQCPICKEWKEEIEFVHNEDGFIQRDCIACRDAWYYQSKNRVAETMAAKMGLINDW